MYVCTGHIVIKKIQGRKGEFAVGKLTTPIGVFEVKTPQLEQFDAGQYSGTFTIAEILLSTTLWKGRAWTEVQARLAGMELDIAREPAPPEDGVEPDPVDTVPAPPPAHAPHRPATGRSPRPRPRTAPPTRSPRETGHDRHLEELLGELYPLLAKGAPIRLDSTLDRPRLRAQMKALSDAGYTFNHTNQTWARS